MSFSDQACRGVFPTVSNIGQLASGRKMVEETLFGHSTNSLQSNYQTIKVHQTYAEDPAPYKTPGVVLISAVREARQGLER
jgi:hypothetical protein